MCVLLLELDGWSLLVDCGVLSSQAVKKNDANEIKTIAKKECRVIIFFEFPDILIEFPEWVDCSMN
ncbi:MAG: hypothetical protein Q9M92_14750 [Enterobacterales bacterium]|nr:hypothetical protein [Enterobacterales bacterium]